MQTSLPILADPVKFLQFIFTEDTNSRLRNPPWLWNPALLLLELGLGRVEMPKVESVLRFTEWALSSFGRIYLMLMIVDDPSLGQFDPENIILNS